MNKKFNKIKSFAAGRYIAAELAAFDHFHRLFMSPTSKKLSGKRIYTCPTCNRDFNQCGNVVEHMRTHTGEKPFTCTICDKGNIFVCPSCGKECSQLVNLQRHQRTHTGERPYKCEICSKDFKSPSNLKEHVLIHQAERRYTCPECSFSFKTCTNMRKHVRRIHQRARTWICEQCGQPFPCNYELKTHLLRHSGERPFKCKVCGQTFNRKSTLHRHENIHNGFILGHCHICGLAFSRSDTYVTHLKRHGKDVVAFYKANKKLHKEKGYTKLVAQAKEPETNKSLFKRSTVDVSDIGDQKAVETSEPVLLDKQSAEVDFNKHKNHTEKIDETAFDSEQDFITIKIEKGSTAPKKVRINLC